MLTDAALKHLKPKDKIYKVTDRDGMYVLVKPSGTLTFRLDYRMNGRRETVTFGKYGPAGLSLARARELCIDAKRAIGEGRSPAIEKQREKRRLLEAKSFGQFGEKWLTAAPMADSTRAMRRSIFERELLPKWRNRLLTEITPDDLRALCGASATSSPRLIDERLTPTSARRTSAGIRKAPAKRCAAFSSSTPGEGASTIRFRGLRKMRTANDLTSVPVRGLRAES